MPDRERIERAKRSMSHRGPDVQAAVYLPNGCLGHTLLSIIGQEPVIQPIRSHDERAILVFNGEIYNYLELLEGRPALRDACRHRGRSDTVVLVEGLRLYGDAFLAELNGMFAFAYHDLDTGATLLVRDRLGIKPLFYSKMGESVVFASESHAVRILSGQPYDPDLYPISLSDLF